MEQLKDELTQVDAEIDELGKLLDSVEGEQGIAARRQVVALVLERAAIEDEMTSLRASAGTDPGFLALLRAGGITAPAPDVLDYIGLYYGSAVCLALWGRSVDRAVTLYNFAALLPSKTIVKLLREKKQFTVCDPLFQGSKLLLCYDSNMVSGVLKPLLAAEFEAARELRRKVTEAGEDGISPYVTRFQVFDTDSLRRRYDLPAVDTNQYFSMMPCFTDALRALPNDLLAGHLVELLWEHVSSGLRALHKLGYAHMDIKPANIAFEMEDGEIVKFCIIDLDSAAPPGTTTSSTPSYIPSDMLPTGGGFISSFEQDWWMLAVTLCEKCCGGKKPVNCSWTCNQILGCLQENLRDGREGGNSKIVEELKHAIEQAKHRRPATPTAACADSPSVGE